MGGDLQIEIRWMPGAQPRLSPLPHPSLRAIGFEPYLLGAMMAWGWGHEQEHERQA